VTFRSSAAVRVSPTVSVVRRVASETVVIVAAMSPAPCAASDSVRFISWVVAVCSSTAEAMVSWMPLIRSMIAEISPIAVTAPLVSDWIDATRREMSSVAFAVSWARSLT
jgi:hypothetical protein